ncbi:hypothetical protein FRE64_15205 [Euhalothece natronophila Z-M001]|uniref:SspI n=1 Tax=Euhalothece natronophila Z-M001 TaxID=522448 RepID=A0A5B8NPD6_9CHRO|nr:hypothetical protein [Euhalothece natronophila]QDZ41173.1 hypothetical protein FRE64_15205 [Euhalothece natronophila Z-M001]
MTNNPYKDFTNRLQLLVKKYPSLITTTLSNIFTMRLVGNKTHGDLAEIAIAEFINQYMYDFKSIHVGKDLYRKKSKEEDIKITNEITQEEFSVSLKAYGNGPLQLSTDKESQMFSRLEQEGNNIIDMERVQAILSDPAFTNFYHINVLPLIYDEKNQRCNILVFNYERAINDTVRITRYDKGSGRKHPVYKFYNASEEYICEVRYGKGDANALQRGLWTHTKNGLNYFDSITNGWIEYSHNLILVKLLSHALVSSDIGHQSALEIIEKDIIRMKQASGIER